MYISKTEREREGESETTSVRRLHYETDDSNRKIQVKGEKSGGFSTLENFLPALFPLSPPPPLVSG
jgi:hypothetical protein